MSRVLRKAENQITQTYAEHCAKVESGQGWAKGVDVVKKPNSICNIIAHTKGIAVKVVDYIKGHELDEEGFGYGNYVLIQHDYNYYTLYAHMESVCIKEGQTISKSQTIGRMGNTGNSYGAHLHFELRKYSTASTSNYNDTSIFEWLNPEPYLDADLPSSATPKLEGHLDYIKLNKKELSSGGWAYKNGGGQNVIIKIFYGTNVKRTQSVKADESRPDVKTAKGYKTDKVGFTTVIDTTGLTNAEYKVRGYVGSEQLIGEKTLRIKNFIYAGKMFKLQNTDSYNTEYSTATTKRTQTLYAWESEITNTNGRIRMTNAPNKVGKLGQVTCWCNINDLI